MEQSKSLQVLMVMVVAGWSRIKARFSVQSRGQARRFKILTLVMGGSTGTLIEISDLMLIIIILSKQKESSRKLKRPTSKEWR